MTSKSRRTIRRFVGFSREEADEVDALHQAQAPDLPFSRWARERLLGVSHGAHASRLELKERALQAVTRQRDRAVADLKRLRSE